MDLQVGPEQPIIANEKGGLQAKNIYAFHLIDSGSLFEMAKVLGEGAEKYAVDNWRKISSDDHYDHMQAHILADKMGDKKDNHKGHALTRCMMWYATAIEEEKLGKVE